MMPRSFSRALLFVSWAVLVAACSKPYDGISDYDRQQMAKQAAADEAKNTGLKMTEQNYPLGKAWVVDMKGMTVTEEHFQKLKEAGYVAELDLSRSTITDHQLGQMREIGVTGTLFKLDLSNTAVTDAGLQKLEGLPYLIHLNVSGTKVTPAGVSHYTSVRKDNPKIGPAFKNPTVTR